MYRLRSRNSYSPDEVMAAIEDTSNSVLFPSLEKNLNRIMKSNALIPANLPVIDEVQANSGRPFTVPSLSKSSPMLSSKHLKLVVSQDMDSVSRNNHQILPALNINSITREKLRTTLLRMKVSQLE